MADAAVRSTLRRKLRAWQYECHTIESQPLTHTFHVLWEGSTNWCLTQRTSRPSKNREDFRLRQFPDTIVWESNIPKGWYHYEEERDDGPNGSCRVGNVKKEKVDTKKIDAAFTAGKTDDQIVAVYLAKAAEGTQEVTRIEYMTTTSLRDFLFSRNRGKGTCLVQQWVEPQNQHHNDVIQAVWTSSLKCLVERRRNKSYLRDSSVPIQDRAVTFDGPPHLSEWVNVSGKLREQVCAACGSIADHFKENTVQGPRQAPRHFIARMVVQFKIDARCRLILLHVLGARVAVAGKRNKMFVALNLSPAYRHCSAADTCAVAGSAYHGGAGHEREVEPCRKKDDAPRFPDNREEEDEGGKEAREGPPYEDDHLALWPTGRVKPPVDAVAPPDEPNEVTHLQSDREKLASPVGGIRPARRSVRLHPMGSIVLGTVKQRSCLDNPRCTSPVHRQHSAPSKVDPVPRRKLEPRAGPALARLDLSGLGGKAAAARPPKKVPSLPVAHVVGHERAHSNREIAPSVVKKLFRMVAEAGPNPGVSEARLLRKEYLSSFASAELLDTEKAELVCLTLRRYLKDEGTRVDVNPVEDKGNGNAFADDCDGSDPGENPLGRWAAVSRLVRCGFAANKVASVDLLRELGDVVYRLESHRIIRSQATFTFSVPDPPALLLPHLEAFLLAVNATGTPPGHPPHPRLAHGFEIALGDIPSMRPAAQALAAAKDGIDRLLRVLQKTASRKPGGVVPLLISALSSLGRRSKADLRVSPRRYHRPSDVPIPPSLRPNHNAEAAKATPFHLGDPFVISAESFTFDPRCRSAEEPQNTPQSGATNIPTQPSRAAYGPGVLRRGSLPTQSEVTGSENGDVPPGDREVEAGAGAPSFGAHAPLATSADASVVSFDGHDPRCEPSENLPKSDGNRRSTVPRKVSLPTDPSGARYTPGVLRRGPFAVESEDADTGNGDVPSPPTLPGDSEVEAGAGAPPLGTHASLATSADASVVSFEGHDQPAENLSKSEWDRRPSVPRKVSFPTDPSEEGYTPGVLRRGPARQPVAADTGSGDVSTPPTLPGDREVEAGAEAPSFDTRAPLATSADASVVSFDGHDQPAENLSKSGWDRRPSVSRRVSFPTDPSEVAYTPGVLRRGPFAVHPDAADTGNGDVPTPSTLPGDREGEAGTGAPSFGTRASLAANADASVVSFDGHDTRREPAEKCSESDRNHRPTAPREGSLPPTDPSGARHTPGVLRRGSTAEENAADHETPPSPDRRGSAASRLSGASPEPEDTQEAPPQEAPPQEAPPQQAPPLDQWGRGGRQPRAGRRLSASTEADRTVYAPGALRRGSLASMLPGGMNPGGACPPAEDAGRPSASRRGSFPRGRVGGQEPSPPPASAQARPGEVPAASSTVTPDTSGVDDAPHDSKRVAELGVEQSAAGLHREGSRREAGCATGGPEQTGASPGQSELTAAEHVAASSVGTDEHHSSRQQADPQAAPADVACDGTAPAVIAGGNAGLGAGSAVDAGGEAVGAAPTETESARPADDGGYRPAAFRRSSVGSAAEAEDGGYRPAALRRPAVQRRAEPAASDYRPAHLRKTSLASSVPVDDPPAASAPAGPAAPRSEGHRSGQQRSAARTREPGAAAGAESAADGRSERVAQARGPPEASATQPPVAAVNGSSRATPGVAQPLSSEPPPACDLPTGVEECPKPDHGEPVVDCTVSVGEGLLQQGDASATHAEPDALDQGLVGNAGGVGPMERVASQGKSNPRRLSREARGSDEAASETVAARPPLDDSDDEYSDGFSDGSHGDHDPADPTALPDDYSSDTPA
ncbi:hypothetical protein DIPPA_25550 [Diplonema papillatum]|nr:hypothetical protein DIPPA_02703 [Diplonema papillatum]KAJ9452641.1 hypothetical protein DIPPA_25550 [Diplonema papillatum]|eukprot:gene22718-34790_t